MTASDVAWQKMWWVAVIPAGCLLVSIALYIGKFHNNLSADQAVWGQLGDYVGGLINPIISLVGLFAVIVTLRANVVALEENRRQLYAQLFAQSESHFVSLEQSLATVPSALRFHGIDPQALEDAGISAAEFGYLMANFTAGGINIKALGIEDRSPFPPGDYYRMMLESPHTRRAWPILRRLMSPSGYKSRIEATISEIESGNANIWHDGDPDMQPTMSSPPSPTHDSPPSAGGQA